MIRLRHASQINARGEANESRSQRYAYIPTATVLTELRKEGFQPFMVTQTRTRHEDRRDYTKHMIRLRHASQINARAEEIGRETGRERVCQSGEYQGGAAQ